MMKCAPEEIVGIKLDLLTEKASPGAYLPEILIKPRRGWQTIGLGELWHYRELMFFLTWRDVKVRYKQAVLGIFWAVLQPFATMIAFTLFFSQLEQGSPNGIPYPIIAFCGLVPWIFFANAVGTGSQSVFGSQNLISKIYFPRLIIPMGAVGVCLVDCGFSLIMLAILFVYYNILPGWSLFLLPLIILVLGFAALGLAAGLSALTMCYRDFRYVVPFMIQLWMFVTPTVYMRSRTILNPTWQILLPLNPAYGLIGNFRAAVLGEGLDFYTLGVSSFVSVILLVGGCFYFRKVERKFADVF